MSEKVAEWLKVVSSKVVVVNPRTKQVLVYVPGDVKVLEGDATLDGGEVVPGWQLPIKKLLKS